MFQRMQDNSPPGQFAPDNSSLICRLEKSQEIICPVVDKRTKNNLYNVKSWVHIFSGPSGSVVDKRTKNNLYNVKSWVHIFSGPSGSVVDKRTKNNLYNVKSWVHIFSGSFGSVVDKRTRS